MKSLSAKHRAFVASYLVHFNATKAALEAGYSERRAQQTGSDLLKRPDVRAAIDAEFEEHLPSSAESLARIGSRARSDMADVAAELGHGELLKAREAGLDTKVIHKLRFHPPQALGEKETLAALELYNAQGADEALLKVAGRLEDRVRVVVEGELALADSLLIEALTAEFGGEEDAATLDRIQRALAKASAAEAEADS